MDGDTKIHFYVIGGIWFGICVIFYIIYDWLLFFIPARWGMDSSGDGGYRSNISVLLAIITCYYVHKKIRSRRNKIFKQKIYATKEAKAAFDALDEAALRLHPETFQLVRTIIEESLLANLEVLVSLIRESGDRIPREWVYTQIAYVTRDLLISGHRGVQNSKGLGKNLLEMYDAAYDELIQIKAIEPEYANQQKLALRGIVG